MSTDPVIPSLRSLAIELLTFEQAEREERRKADFNAARTQEGRMLALGILCTPDDEMERAYAWAYCQERAQKEGKTPAEVEAEWNIEKAEGRVISQLREVVRIGETHAERWARVEAAMAAAQGTMANGKPCRHRTTQKERGWVNKEGWFYMQAEDDAGALPFKCCRCKVEITVLKATEPTEAAMQARAILEAHGLPIQRGPYVRYERYTPKAYGGGWIVVDNMQGGNVGKVWGEEAEAKTYARRLNW